MPYTVKAFNNSAMSTTQALPTKWRKIITPTKVDGRPVFVTISYDAERPRLSLTGVEGPRFDGNAYGESGQITLRPEQAAEPWTMEEVALLGVIWERWHLNDMRAGSPAQEEHLRVLKARGEKPPAGVSHYEWACRKLALQGLHPDRDWTDGGYRYGSRWLCESVPDEVLAWLYSRPDATAPHPWGPME